MTRHNHPKNASAPENENEPTGTFSTLEQHRPVTALLRSSFVPFDEFFSSKTKVREPRPPNHWWRTLDGNERKTCGQTLPGANRGGRPKSSPRSQARNGHWRRSGNDPPTLC